LSVDAVHESGIEVVVAPGAARPVGAVGGDVSGHADVDAVIVARVETFPAASTAWTPSVWLVPHVRPVNVKLVVVGVPALTPSRKTVYPATPTLSVEAVQEVASDDVVELVTAKAAGAVGAVVSGQVAAEAVIDACGETLPAASNACTASVWLVPQASPVNVNDVVVIVPALTPSRKTVYPVTPTLSVDAVQDAEIDVVVAAVLANPVGADGAVVSGHADVEAVTLLRVETLPAASNAWTPSVWLVPQAMPVNVNDVVVVVPALTPSRKTV
jgi:hypothetical protein